MSKNTGGTHFYRIGNKEIFDDQNSDKSENIEPQRKLIESWLAAVFQSEHLALVLDRGFTKTIAYQAGFHADDAAAHDNFIAIKRHILNPQPQALAYAHAGSVQQPDYQAFHAFCVTKQLLNFRPTADRWQLFSSFGTRKIAEITDLFFQHFPIQGNQRVKRLVLGCAVAWYCGEGISLIGSIARGLGTLSGAEQVNESFISGGGLSKTDKSPKDSPRNCS